MRPIIAGLLPAEVSHPADVGVGIEAAIVFDGVEVGKDRRAVIVALDGDQSALTVLAGERGGGAGEIERGEPLAELGALEASPALDHLDGGKVTGTSATGGIDAEDIVGTGSGREPDFECAVAPDLDRTARDEGETAVDTLDREATLSGGFETAFCVLGVFLGAATAEVGARSSLRKPS